MDSAYMSPQCYDLLAMTLVKIPSVVDIQNCYMNQLGIIRVESNVPYPDYQSTDTFSYLLRNIVQHSECRWKFLDNDMSLTTRMIYARVQTQYV